jgi:exodeoxyribonuclease VII large subunit
MTADFFQFRQQLFKPQPASPHAPNQINDGAGAMTVSQITEKIRQILASNLPASLLVRGEVSNLNRNKSSGHVYFTLKDKEACLDCVMYRSDAARLKFEPQNGMELLAQGRIGIYPARGRHQLYITTLRPLGRGALELAFQQVKAKLEAEGLFDPARKKPLPRYPRRIILVTSREAAALADILKVLRRFPWLRVMLYPVPVQGDGAGSRIAAAIRHVNATIEQVGGGDVVLLARGGGSLEDLWAFNEEAVARAVAASRIPVITGIGHEVDVSIADLVADHHAHTPTEAAQVLTGHWRQAADLISTSTHRLTRGLRVAITHVHQRLAMIERHEAFRRPLDRLNVLRQLLDDYQRMLSDGQERIIRTGHDRVTAAQRGLERFLPGTLLRFNQLLSERRRRLDQALVGTLRLSHNRLARLQTVIQKVHPQFRISLAAQRLGVAETGLNRAIAQDRLRVQGRLDALARQLEAVSPQAVLRRGYTITSRKKDGIPLKSAANLKPGDKIVTRFADGQTESVVEDTNQMSLFE